MDPSAIPARKTEGAADIAIVGCGPAALVVAIALARRGIRTTVFERDPHPEQAPRFNPDRSYTIDISGHGLRALRHIDACSYFDDRMIRFKGLKIPGGGTEEWTLPGWTGSRGDILRALIALATERYQLARFQFGMVPIPPGVRRWDRQHWPCAPGCNWQEQTRRASTVKLRSTSLYPAGALRTTWRKKNGSP